MGMFQSAGYKKRKNIVASTVGSPPFIVVSIRGRGRSSSGRCSQLLSTHELGLSKASLTCVLILLCGRHAFLPHHPLQPHPRPIHTLRRCNRSNPTTLAAPPIPAVLIYHARGRHRDRLTEESMHIAHSAKKNDL